VALFLIFFICYGDDLLYNMSEDKMCQSYFSIDRFSLFLKEFFDMDLRDTKPGLTFMSKQYQGWLTHTGGSFLRHYAVENPNKENGQSISLPFRESREILARAVWGREVKSRDSLDVMLSCIGHAWGTYGSNRDAYDRLRLFFLHLASSFNGDFKREMTARVMRLKEDSVRKMRVMGITPDIVCEGFPSWDQIQKHNILDPAYQDIAVDDIYDINDLLDPGSF